MHGLPAHASTRASQVLSILLESSGCVGRQLLGNDQAVALFHVEDGVVGQNKGGALVLCFFGGAVVVLLAVKLLVEDDLCAFLALADGSAHLLSLLVGEPEWSREGSGPEQQDVDAAVGSAGLEVAGKVAAFVGCGGPGLLPGSDAVAEAVEDAVGDGVVDAGVCCCSWWASRFA